MENFEKIELRPDFTAKIVTPYIGSGEPKIPFIVLNPISNEYYSFDYVRILKDPQTEKVLFILGADYGSRLWRQSYNWDYVTHTMDNNAFITIPRISQTIKQEYISSIFQMVREQIIKDGFEIENESVFDLPQGVNVVYTDPMGNIDKRAFYLIQDFSKDFERYGNDYNSEVPNTINGFTENLEYVFKILRTDISFDTFATSGYYATIEKPFLFGDTVQPQTLFKDDKVYKYSPIEIPVRLDVNNLLNPPGNYQLNNDNQFIIYEKNDY